MQFSKGFRNSVLNGGLLEAFVDGRTELTIWSTPPLDIETDTVSTPPAGERLFLSVTTVGVPMVLGSPSDGRIALIGNWGGTISAGTPTWFRLSNVISGTAARIQGTIPGDMKLGVIAASQALSIPEIVLELDSGMQFSGSGSFA